MFLFAAVEISIKLPFTHLRKNAKTGQFSGLKDNTKIKFKCIEVLK
jgi:hypothetical protein